MIIEGSFFYRILGRNEKSVVVVSHDMEET